MKVKDRIENFLKRHKLGRMFVEEYNFKTAVFALASLVINVAFVVMNTVSALIYNSGWYGYIAGYYLLLILFRAALLAADKKCNKKFGGDSASYAAAQNKIYLGSGIFLVIVHIAMCFAVAQIIIHERTTPGGTVMAIATAAYAFLKISMAIYNIVKSKKVGSLVAQSLRNLNFASACMTMVSLTVLLLTVFGEGKDLTFDMTMKACVGLGACAIVLAVAISMIVFACKNFKVLKSALKAQNCGEIPEDSEQG